MRIRPFLPATLVVTALLWQTPAFAATQPAVSVVRLKAIMSQMVRRHGRTAALSSSRRTGASTSATQSIPRAANKLRSELAAERARLRALRVQHHLSPPASPLPSSSSSSSAAPLAPALTVSPRIPTVYQRPDAPRVQVSARVEEIRAQILSLVNIERANTGLAPLAESEYLDASAQQYAMAMAQNDFFSHTGPDGSSSTDRIRLTGYLAPPCDCDWTFWTGENLGKGQRTADDVMRDWMNSPGHRANIMNANYTDIGIGYADGYWVQHFGSVQRH